MKVQRWRRPLIYIVAFTLVLDFIGQFLGVLDPVLPGIGPFTFLLLLVVIALLLGLAKAWLNKRQPQEFIDYPKSQEVHRRSRLHFAPFPSFGLVAVFALLPVGVFFWSLPIWPKRSQGINVVISPRAIESTSTPRYGGPVTVRIVRARFQANYFVNSRAVDREDLATALQRELKLRPEWAVYVDADRDLPWEVVAQVMDTVQGLNAKIVVAPSSRSTPPQGNAREP